MPKDRKTDSIKNGNDDEIDLVRMIGIIWQRKWFVILGTLSVTALAIVVSLLLPRVYRADGFMDAYWPYRDVKEEAMKLKKGELDSFGYRIELAESKKLLRLLRHDELFLKFSQKSQERLGLDSRLAAALDADSKKIRVVYALKTAAKAPEKKRNFVIGFHLIAYADSAKNAAILVGLLKEFVSRIIINNEIIEYIKINVNWEKYKLLRNENRIINLGYELAQLREREKVLRQVSKEFPSLNRLDQIVVGGNNRDYFSPLQQLAAAKIEIADVEEKIAEIERESLIASDKLTILEQFNRFLKGDPDVLISLDLMDNIRGAFSGVTKNKGQDEEIYQLVRNEIEERLSYFTQLNSYVLKLAVEPTLPKFPVSPRKRVIAAAAFVCSVLFFIFLAFFMEAYQIRKRHS